MQWQRFSNPVPAYRPASPKSPLIVLAMEQGSGSDLIAQILDVKDNADAPFEISYEYDLDTVREPEVWEARDEIIRLSQESLAKRLPPRFKVWRGGRARTNIVPVTTQLSTAKFHAKFRGNKGQLYECMIHRSDVLADIDIFQWGFLEGELLIPRDVFDKDCQRVA